MNTRRVGLSMIVGILACVTHYLMRDVRFPGNDFFPLWQGSRLFVAGRNPYELIGPGLEINWLWLLNYPATAFVAAAPFTLLPPLPAGLLFVGMSAGLFTYAITQDGWHKTPALVSLPFFLSVVAAQSSPLFASALVLPAVAVVMAVKPTTGFAIAVSGSWTVMRNAIIGGLLLLTVSLILDPHWISRWIPEVHRSTHVRSPVLRLGGIAILLAVLRWKRWEGRLLLAMALVPQTGSWYGLVPLFLIPQSLNEAMVLCMATGLGWMAGALLITDNFDNQVGALMIATGYLPCLIMVLRRPNERTEIKKARLT